MAKSNRDRVSDVMWALKKGLGPYVLREYKRVHRGNYLTVLRNTVNYNREIVPDYVFNDEEEVLEEIDAPSWMKAMIYNWDEVFRDKLGHSDRSYISELLDQRNDWAHQKSFSTNDAYRVADTAERLLRAVNAPKQAEIVQEIAQELLFIRMENERKRAQREAPKLDEAPTTAAGLKPWRYIVQPHPDVASGRYIQAEFAADLAQVVKNEASPEYGDPKEFFRRTYLTRGLSDLLATGLKRLNGIGGDPVIQLQTSFGGGKTHSMLALYHLANGDIGVHDIPGGENIMDMVGDVEDRIKANVAVIVGTAFDATSPRIYDNVTTNTLWGDMAYQLGGTEGYALLEDADLTGVSPGSDTLKKLLEHYGPCLIIIDELVAFARNLYKVVDRLPAGTFDAVMTFMQSLTEAVKRSSDSILLVSIPESDIEIGGEGGKAALDYLSKTIGRIESVWQPITAMESFEIVRRRLFSDEIDYASRESVLNAFRDMYTDNSGEYPSGVAEGDYYRRMEAAYPIHPELFDRLYQDWSTLERFQRTRGVLRLMASVIHELWLSEDQSLMIMPSSIPLSASNVRNEVLRYLPDNWHAIVDTDVDGDEAQPYNIDNNVPTLGRYRASRRIARTIFMGSAPSVSEQGVRGIEEVRIYLGTVQPGEPTATFGDALRRMGNQLTYLYTDGNRYWYDTRPTVNRIARDRAQNIHSDLVFEEQVRRLRKLPYSKNDFAGVHIAPLDSSDVVDAMRARLVVIDPTLTHKRRVDSQALEFASEILEKRGNAPRLYRNMLVFIAPDATGAEALVEAVRDYLAWKSISDEEEELNLDAQQRKQVRTSLERATENVDLRLQEAYSWLLVPVQPNPTGDIEFEEHRISGNTSFYERAANKLSQSDYVILRWSPVTLNMQLQKYYWDKYPHYSVKKLWEDLASYCYFPRLFNQSVLLDAISDGIAVTDDAPFGYAAAVDNDQYIGLKYGQVGNIYFDGNDVIVRKDVAKHYAEQSQADTIDEPQDSSDADVSNSQPEIPDEPPQIKDRRYYGSVDINPQRVNREIGVIVDEIIERLVGNPGTDVQIRLEISASNPDGFDDSTVRTIKENSRTLKFNNFDFEAD